MNEHNLLRFAILLFAISINVAKGDEEAQLVPQTQLPTTVELDKNLFLLAGVKPDVIAKIEETFNDATGFLENDPAGQQIDDVIRDLSMLSRMKVLLRQRVRKIDPKALWSFPGEAEKGSALEREILHLGKVEAAATTATARLDRLSLQKYGKTPEQLWRGL